MICAIRIWSCPDKGEDGVIKRMGCVRLSPYLVMKAFPKAGDSPYIENGLLSKRVTQDEKVIWQLLDVCRDPQEYSSLVSFYGKERVDMAIAEQWLMEEEKLFSVHRVTRFELEINTDCNNRCLYCPVHQSRAERNVMSMELFREVIEKIQEYGQAHFLTFNFYNEPFLDPYFIQRLELLATTDLKVLINTNASYIKDGQMEALKRFRQSITMIQINIPSYERAEYNRITGSCHYNNVKKNINRLFEANLPVNFSINGSISEFRKNAPLLNNLFSERVVHGIYRNFTTDRAGTLDNQYAQNIHIKSSLAGCESPLQTMNIGWNGDVILCCNDYYKKNIYGNIRDGKLEEILRSEKAIALRKQVFGETQTDDEFLCRKCWFMKLTKKQRADFLIYLSKAARG